MKRLLQRSAYSIMPEMARRLETRLWLKRRAAELRSRAAGCDSAAAYLDALQSVEGFEPAQKNSELLAILARVGALRPVRMCEIGAAGGGTLFLFARMCAPGSLVISIDLSYSMGRRRLLGTFANGRQRVVCLEADSHVEKTKRKVERLLDGSQLDFLFIDGDHSYQGVEADFVMYSPLVRPGGIIALHDIVADQWTRTGRRTIADSGEVPRFWKDLRPRLEDYEEFIEDPAQDGFGLGVIHWTGRLL